MLYVISGHSIVLRQCKVYYSVYWMSSAASLRERKSTRIDYKNLHLGKPGRNMAAEENGDFIFEEEMTPARTRLFKSKNAVSETETENGDGNDDDSDFY